jgi:hypothetical protein
MNHKQHISTKNKTPLPSHKVTNRSRRRSLEPQIKQNQIVESSKLNLRVYFQVHPVSLAVGESVQGLRFSTDQGSPWPPKSQNNQSNSSEIHRSLTLLVLGPASCSFAYMCKYILFDLSSCSPSFLCRDSNSLSSSRILSFAFVSSKK